MHEGLPPALVKPLLALWHKGRPGGGSTHSSSAIAAIDAKTSRLALSIAGLLLGPGEAGTPTPLPGAAPPSAAVDAGAAEAVRASLAGVAGLDSEASSSCKADPTPGLTEGALRLLAAAARGGNGSGGGGGGGAASNNNSTSTSSSSASKWDADFVSALGVALARGEARAAAFLDANGEAGATALAALAAAAAEAATEGGGAGEGGGASSSSPSSSSSSKILGALTSSSAVAKRRAAAAAAVADASDALHGALAAARASLKGRALRDAALRAGAGAGSSDPLCARHALALMACVARGDPARAARAFGLIRNDGGSRKSSNVLASFDLAAAASTALAAYETSALMLGGGGKGARPSSGGLSSSGSASSSSTLSSTPSPTPGLNLDDPLARVHAARLLGAMLFAGIGGGSAAAAVSYSSETNNGGGASMFSLLAALATRDADDMVALEACKALAGWSGAAGGGGAGGGLNAFSSASASNDNSSTSTSSNTVMDEASTRDAAARARAFAVLCARANDIVDDVTGGLMTTMTADASSGRSLLSALCSRVRGSLLSGNAPLVCAGARAAAALAESAVRGYDAAVGTGGGGNANSSSKRAAKAQARR